MDNHQLSHLLHIQEAMNKNRLVLFVGAGVSFNSGVPMWNELIRCMKEELPETLCNETDDLKIAQLYKDSRGHKEYMDKIKKILKFNQVIPNPIHQILLDLSPSHIVSTNYDDLIEQEIKLDYKQYSIVRSDNDIPNLGYPNTLVKMHGDYFTDNIVLSENDYYDYARNFPLTRAFILSLFASKLVVFVGFSFNDLNLKMILREISTLLSDRMQHVYLLSLTRPDDVTKKYFLNKGINIVYFSDDEINNLILNCDKKLPENICLSDPNGAHLYKLLFAIKNYNPSLKADLFEDFFSKILRYKNDIRVFGEGLKYLMPSHMSRSWHSYHEGYQVFSKYTKNLSNQLSTYSGKKEFLLNHPRFNRLARIELKKLAYYNYAYEFDSIRIVDQKFLDNIAEYIPENSVDFYHSFKFNSLKYRIDALSTRQLNGTIDDLEYPYILCKLGNFYGAYLQYNKILKFTWDKERYIIYFLALYNVFTIKYLVKHQIEFEQRNINARAITEELEKIDILEVLSRLPIEKNIRHFLQDMVLNKSLSSLTGKIDNLRDKLHRQRISANKGGWSLNNDINALWGAYEREFQFCNWNYLIQDYDEQYILGFQNAMAGIFNSYMTKDKEHQTKIFSFNSSILILFIFSPKNDYFWQLVNQYDLKSIKLDNDTINWVKNVIDSIIETRQIPFYDIYKWKNILANFLSILSLSEDYEYSHDKIYKILLLLLEDPSCLIHFKSAVKGIIHRFQPTIQVAKQLLDIILSYDTCTYNYIYAIRKLVYVLKESNELYNYDIKVNYKDTSADAHALLYPIVSDDKKTILIENVFSHSTILEHMLYFITENNIEIRDPKWLEDRLSSYATHFESNRVGVCMNLIRMRNNDTFSNVHNIIDKYKEKSSCMCFLSDPLNFNQYEKLHVDWITELSDNDLKAVVKDPEIRKIINEWIVGKSGEDKDIKRIIDIL